MALRLRDGSVRFERFAAGLVGLGSVFLPGLALASDALDPVPNAPPLLGNGTPLPLDGYAPQPVNEDLTPGQNQGSASEPPSPIPEPLPPISEPPFPLAESSAPISERPVAQSPSETENSAPEAPSVPETDILQDLDLDPGVIENSPVLEDWLQEVPDIADEIRNQPSFRTRLRVGYAQFPTDNQAGGIHLSIEDVFVVANSGLTASGSFNRSWNNERESFGAQARYYLFPLGGYVNLAPTLGYRSLETSEYTTNGLDIGFRFMFIPSRGGGADIAISQQWVAPGGQKEVSITSLSVGYAVTQDLRLGTDWELHQSSSGQNSRIGLVLEWLM